MQLGDRIRACCNDRDCGIFRGQVYTVFGERGDLVAVRVNDPDDQFGGVVEVPRRCFDAMPVDVPPEADPCSIT